MKIMAVDFGDSRTGLAVCDKSEFLASPAGVIEEKDFEKCIEKVAAAAKENAAEEIVVGYPKNMNNTIGPKGEIAIEFQKELQEKLNIEVVPCQNEGIDVVDKVTK